MEYNLGLMSARSEGQERGRGSWAVGSAPSPPATGSEGHYNLS